VNPQTKYKDEIIKELQDIPDEDMPKLLEIVHYLKTGMKESRKKVRVKKSKDPLFDLRNIAVETGIKELAEHHDHYLYGVSK
jgi:Ribonuclease G/E